MKDPNCEMCKTVDDLAPSLSYCATHDYSDTKTHALCRLRIHKIYKDYGEGYPEESTHCQLCGAFMMYEPLYSWKLSQLRWWFRQLHFHVWYKTENNGGQPIRACKRCGAIKRGHKTKVALQSPFRFDDIDN